MTPAVVDTDVVSFLFKNDSRAQLYLPLMRNRELLVSFMTEAELEQWILLARRDAVRVRRIRIFMSGTTRSPLPMGNNSCAIPKRVDNRRNAARPPGSLADT
jgi:predicted nucleic acid-binding protein